MLLFQSASLQVPSSKSALVPAGVERKNPTSRNTNSSQSGSAHVAAGSGQTCELVAWPKLRSWGMRRERVWGQGGVDPIVPFPIVVLEQAAPLLLTTSSAFQSYNRFHPTRISLIFHHLWRWPGTSCLLLPGVCQRWDPTWAEGSPLCPSPACPAPLGYITASCQQLMCRVQGK